ncbi:putative E3 ubiquitin-protein ligase ARI2 OS=Arabidopsis thaliana GN=ARI2 PE=2 SV=1 [Rhizoctonia solani AG-1 IB]|uniref:RBR-type E3 ubiquitin transferase n=1 Tax=Thanatephorus cucumeris (strain AG1-IB / isolate 7/3/14) TaxID=1108050 RepID=A0A0B7FZL0_THACB|nr:putative E3 ubiquitin-protein ligase ARI2 OS=Arabidopsis thaliana GN=ARI2 PE=2 SV=1 [Rhizoctonia solani AG-1 IB]
MGEENELMIEMTAHLDLLDLEDRRAELMPDDPFLSELKITYDLIETEIQSTLQYVRGLRIARAIRDVGRAVDPLLVNTITQNELRAQSLRGYLLGLPDKNPCQSSGSSPTASSSSSGHGSSTSNLELSGLSGLYFSTPYLLGPKRRIDENIPLILRLPDGRDEAECIICTGLTAAAYRAPCGCFYDQNCIIALFTKAMNDESLFPPRCCTKIISLDQVRSILSPEFIQKFEEKEKEFGTPNRLYCSNSACSSFLGGAATTERDKTDLTCSTCLISTCSFCKGVAHAAHVPCKNDAAAQQLLALSEQSGWKACPSCHHLVEKNGGCNHMVCRCRNEFCYICGVEWDLCQIEH